MSPDQYCSHKADRAGSMYHYSFLFLPEERRRAVAALYALQRELQMVADEYHDRNVARAKLAWWKREVASIYHGQPQHPVTRALSAVVKSYPVDQARLDELLDGIAMDVEYNAYPDFEALRVYCHRVAGVVAMLCAEILGYQERRTLDCAADLGVAVQLSNIVRNVGRDARRERLYLPLHELAEFDVTLEDITRSRETESFRKLMDFQIARAGRLCDEALAKIPASDRRAQCPGLIMGAITLSLLRELRANPAEVLRHSVELTPIRMLWIAWRTRAVECRP